MIPFNFRAFVSVLLLATMAACSALQPAGGDIQTEPDPIKDGPGLFSGRDGKFTIYGQ